VFFAVGFNVTVPRQAVVLTQCNVIAVPLPETATAEETSLAKPPDLETAGFTLEVTPATTALGELHASV
jgi:hypothetical protein